MPGGRPYRCCCKSCIIWTDEFNDPSIHADWDQRSGTWTQAGGVLSTADNDALIIRNAEYVDGGQISAILDQNTPAQRSARFVLDYQDDANYHFGEYAVDTGQANQVVLRLYNRAGGVNNLITEAPISNSFATAPGASIITCLHDGLFTMVADGGLFIPRGSVVGNTTEHGGKKGGLGTGIGPVGYEWARLSERDGARCGTCAVLAGDCGPSGEFFCGDPGQAAPNVTVYIPPIVNGGANCLACDALPSDQNFVLTWGNTPPQFGCCWSILIPNTGTAFCAGDPFQDDLIINLCVGYDLADLPPRPLYWTLIYQIANVALTWRVPTGQTWPDPANCVNPGNNILVPFFQVGPLNDCTANNVAARIFL